MRPRMHQMGLNPEPLRMMRTGKKRYELRLLDEKRQKLKVGDWIEFTQTDDASQILLVEIINLYIFTNFAELYETVPLLECGYTEADILLAKPEDMEAYYSLDQQTKYGVLAIEIKLLQ